MSGDASVSLPCWRTHCTACSTLAVPVGRNVSSAGVTGIGTMCSLPSCINTWTVDKAKRMEKNVWAIALKKPSTFDACQCKHTAILLQSCKFTCRRDIHDVIATRLIVGACTYETIVHGHVCTVMAFICCKRWQTNLPYFLTFPVRANPARNQQSQSAETHRHYHSPCEHVSIYFNGIPPLSNSDTLSKNMQTNTCTNSKPCHQNIRKVMTYRGVKDRSYAREENDQSTDLLCNQSRNVLREL